jgi:hypothetical protein
MTKHKILVQIDPDFHASVFDAVVATDAGVERLLQYGSVKPEQVQGLVHGAIFTRSPQELANTAIFIGGSNVAAGEALLAEARKAFFGPMRVSVMLDANGCNTTAAAAVLAAAKHVPLKGAVATVLGGTGPVGERAARLLAREGASVRVSSRSRERAAQVCERIRRAAGGAQLSAVSAGSAAEVERTLDGAQVVIAAGAAGVELVAADMLQRSGGLKVAIDLNAVPPAGIGGVEPMDKAADRGGVVCYGAIGVGGTKMKIHRAAIQKLFTANNLVLDAEEVFAIGRELG